MMDLKFLHIYSDFVQSVYAKGLTTEESIANCILSLCGELAEWDLARDGPPGDLLEAGDVLYYITQLLRELDVPVEFLKSPPVICLPTISDTIAVLADRTKKHLFWGESPKYDRQGYKDHILPILSDTISILTDEYSLEDIITANIGKLSARKNISNPLKGVCHD